jgi:hypothetical protein
MPSHSVDHWLKRYYAVRALFSIAWVALAFTIGRSLPPAAVALIVAYPLWDCAANYVDGSRNGGLRANPTQLLNVVVSAVVTLAVITVVPRGFHPVVAVIGVWATLSGILQLASAVRRWGHADAQWPMILSGAQSGLAGVFMLKRASDASVALGVADVAPYAAFGAIYFAISALALAIRQRREHAA